MSDERTLAAAYLVCPSAHQADNAAGRNHWAVHIEEIVDQLGLTAQRLMPDSITPGSLAALSTLILPQPAGKWLDGAARHSMGEWVADGGLLIGMGTEGLDGLFGVRPTDATIDQPDDYSPAAGMVWAPCAETAGVIWPLHPEAPTPILAPVRCLEPADAEPLAHAQPLVGDSSRHTAVCLRRRGLGWCLYFAFDVAKHVWVAHQGRPVDADHDGDGYFRLSDAVPARDFEPEVPYADQILFLLRDVIARTGQPFISPIPPVPGSGAPADVLLFWGGDDEAAEGTHLPASEFMRELGLPYHVNLMPDKQGRFAVTKAEFDAIKANSHEPSMHYDFQTGYEHPYAFTRAEVLEQAEWYERAFGERAACSVFHWCHWVGWSEPAEWMLEAGGCADNSRMHRGSPPLNPTNMIGYSFGTSFPFHFYRDQAGGNERLPFLSEPITLYECGYDPGAGRTDFTNLHRGLDMALRFHLTADMFFHPVYIHGHEVCREAVRETLRWLENHKAQARHTGNDELARWWFARSRARLSGVTASSNRTSFTVTCDWPDGCVVQVPVPEGCSDGRVSGTVRAAVLRNDPGGRWLCVSCPRGSAAVEVEWL